MPGVRSEWIAISGAVVSVSLTLVLSGGQFSLLTSLVGFVLLAYMYSFFTEFCDQHTGALMKSEIIVISFLLLIAPVGQVLLLRYAPDRIAIVMEATANDVNWWQPYPEASVGSSELATDSERRDAITLREGAFILAFLILYVLHRLFGHAIEDRIKNHELKKRVKPREPEKLWQGGVLKANPKYRAEGAAASG